MDKVTNFIIGCILTACVLVVLVVVMLEPEARVLFVRGYVDWLVTAGVLIVCLTLAFVSLLKWS